MRSLLPVAVVAALVLAAPATASAGTPAGDRAGAKAFGAAADRFHATAMQAAPEIRRRMEALDDPACGRAFTDAPRGSEDVLGEFAGAILVDAVFGPLRPSVDAFNGELAAVSTKDRVLRSGRAAWRTMGSIFALAAPVPADACAQLDAWRAAGYPEDALPALPRLTEEMVDATGDSRATERKLQSAGRHMRRLGVKRASARRFTGDALEDVFKAATRGPVKARAATADRDVAALGAAAAVVDLP